MRSFIYYLLLVTIFNCKPEVQRSARQFFPLFSSGEKIEVLYPQEAFEFFVGQEIVPVVPSLTGKVESCKSEPLFPAGIGLSDQCVISGKPSETNNITTYQITAMNGSNSGSTEIKISVLSNTPPSLSYPNSPYIFPILSPVNISPNVVGSIESCSISPALPAGLSISNTCVITGSINITSPATTYNVTASNPYGSTNASLSLEIINLPTVSFDLPVSSGNESILSVPIPVSLSFSSNASVQYSVTGGSATSGVDYTLASGTLTFVSGGVTSQNITLNVIDDSIYELDETVIISLSISSGAIAGTNMSHTYSILNDDSLPTVSFDLSTQSVGEGDGTVNIALSLNTVSGVDVTIPITANASSTAISPDDYVIPSSTVTIPAGSNSGSLVINLGNDLLDEEDETIVLNLGTPTNATATSPLAHTLTIIDDDAPPTVSFTQIASSGAENIGTVNLEVKLSSPSAKTVTVDYSVSGGTAAGGGIDYSLPPSTLTFAPGITVQNIMLSVVNDLRDEPDETVQVSLSNGVNAILMSDLTHTYTMTDDDPPPTVGFSVASQIVSEGVGTVSITAQLSEASGFPVTVPISIDASSTAVSGVDFSALPASISIPAGAIAAGFSLSIINDTLYEGTETLKLNIGTPTNATLGATTSQTITINDDDLEPSISFSLGATGSVNEGNGNYALQFTLSVASGLPASITVNTADIFATAGSDYTAQVNQIVTIPAGSTTGSFNIPILEDLLYEGSETFSVTISSPVGASITGPTVQTVTILDNDIGITSAMTLDCDGNGKIDHYRLVFSSAVTDSSFPGYVLNSIGTATSDWLVAGYTNVRLNHGTALNCGTYTDTVDDAMIYLAFAEGSGFDTGAKPDLTTSATPLLTGPSGTVARIFTPSVTEIDGARPVVVSITPVHTSSGVALNTTITAVFSEDMNTGTFIASNFTLTGAAAITGTVSTVNPTTVMFTPTANLANEQLHTVNISNMTDQFAGNAMVNFTSTFTTALKNKITGTVSGASSGVVLGMSVNGGAVTNLAGTTSTFDTGNVLVNGQAFELSIVTQPVGQVCALLSSNTNPAGGIFNGTTDLVVDVNCVNGYAISGRVQAIPPVENGFHLYQGNVKTIFGDGTPSTIDGIGSNVKVKSPLGIVHTGGYYYFTDSGTMIRRADPASNQVTTVLGSGTSGTMDGVGVAAQFSNLTNLTTDGTFLYASELTRIRRIRIGTWDVTTIAGGGAGYFDGYGTAAQFDGINSVVHWQGSLYISDTNNHRIRRLNLSTLQVTTIAGNGSIATTDNATGVSGSISHPMGMAIIDNSLYITSYFSGVIRKVVLDGTNYPLSLLSGVHGVNLRIDGALAHARFVYPYGMSTDGVNNIFISDNHFIRQINISKGQVSTLAGHDPGSLDGVGVSAQLSPTSVFFDGKEIVFADANFIRLVDNNMIRAYYPLKGNALDYAGNNNLTATGSPSPTTGTRNETGGAYSIGAGNGFRSSPITVNTNVTLAGWVKINSYGSEQVILYNGNSGASGYGFYINPSGVLNLLLGGGGGIFPINPKPATGVWTHLALVSPPSLPGKWKVYMNGKEVLSVVPAVNAIPGDFFCVGISAIGNQNFNGSIADVRLYNRPLNEGEIHELAQNADSALVGNSFSTGATGLLSHYAFSGASTAYGTADRGPLAKHLANANSVGSARGKDGEIDGSMEFNGSNNYLTASSHGLPIANAPRTLCAWVKLDKQPTSGQRFAIISYGNASLNGAELTYWNDGSSFLVSLSKIGDSRNATYKIPLHTWTHLCGAYQGSAAQMYVNGAPFTTGSTALDMTTTLGLFRIGNRVDNSSYFPGKIDDVRIYNNALPPIAVRQLASQNPVGLVARYDFSGDTLDVSGFGNNLTNSGATITVDRFGTGGSAYQFNGTSSYMMNSETTLPLPAGTNDRTICAWMKADQSGAGWTGVRMALAYGNTNSKDASWVGATNLDVPNPGAAGCVFGAPCTPMGHFAVHSWNHVCTLVEGVTTQIIMNGKPLGAPVSASDWITTPGPITVGKLGAQYYFPGSIDEAQIYNRALNLNEIQALAGYHPMQTSAWNSSVPTSSLKVHFQAETIAQTDGASVSSWTDNSGNNNSVAAVTAPSYVLNGIGGRPSVSFNRASSQSLNKTTGTVGLTTPSYSFMGVVSPNVVSTEHSFMSIGSGCNPNDKAVGFRDTNFLMGTSCSILDSTVTSSPVTSGESVLMAHTYRANMTSGSKVYKQGTEVGSFNTPATPYSSDDVLTIGNRPGTGTWFFGGLVSELLYFDSSITPSDRELIECYLSSKYGIPLGHGCP